MGTMTEDITRLCGEIGSWRKGRETLLTSLAREKQDRHASVSAMRAGFSQAQSTMARKIRADLSAFLTGLRREVGGQRRAVRDDLGGASRAWNGQAPRSAR